MSPWCVFWISVSLTDVVLLFTVWNFYIMPFLWGKVFLFFHRGQLLTVFRQHCLEGPILDSSVSGHLCGSLLPPWPRFLRQSSAAVVVQCKWVWTVGKKSQVALQIPHLLFCWCKGKPLSCHRMSIVLLPLRIMKYLQCHCGSFYAITLNQPPVSI